MNYRYEIRPEYEGYDDTLTGKYLAVIFEQENNTVAEVLVAETESEAERLAVSFIAEKGE